MVGPLQAGAPRSIAGLYALTPERSDIDAMTKCVAAALRGGATTIQYRNKTAAPKLRLQQALALRALCAERGATFIVNDDIDLARTVDADGVHLGRDDATITLARARLRTTALVGASCYDSLELAEAAVAAAKPSAVPSSRDAINLAFIAFPSCNVLSSQSAHTPR